MSAELNEQSTQLPYSFKSFDVWDKNEGFCMHVSFIAEKNVNALGIYNSSKLIMSQSVFKAFVKYRKEAKSISLEKVKNVFSLCRNGG